MLVELACDGSCLGNNLSMKKRRMGAAVAITENGINVVVLSQKIVDYETSSNQVAELFAFKIALEYIHDKYKLDKSISYKIHLDSQYVIKTFTKTIQSKHHLELISKIKKLIEPLQSQIEINHVIAHTSDKTLPSRLNKIADEYAKKAASRFIPKLNG